jgi:hypothetical protein
MAVGAGQVVHGVLRGLHYENSHAFLTQKKRLKRMFLREKRCAFKTHFLR